MNVHARARVRVSKPVTEVYDYATETTTLAKVFVGYGAIPAIVHAEMVDGPLRVGGKRRVENTDGSKLTEEILQLERPRIHAYRIVSGLKVPFSLLIHHGDGTWRFQEVNGGTDVSWDYEFELRSALAWPVAALLMRTQFQQAMQRALALLKNQLEAARTA
jgi:hypothetical protein